MAETVLSANLSNNSCSRQLTIVNAVITLIASVVRSIDRSLFFSKLKLLILDSDDNCG